MIKRFSHGPKILVDMANEILDIVEKHSVKPGTNVRVKQSIGGQILDVIQQAGTTTTFPLWPIADVSTNSNPMVTMNYGTYGGQVPTIDGTPLVPTASDNIVTLGPSDIAVYIECDFTFNSVGIVTIVDAEIKSTSSSIPTSTITGSSGGSGTLYQLIFGVTITAPVGSGPYTVVFAPAVGGSQNFGVCVNGPNINGPWGV
jgi:hypothetical protein